MVVSLGIVNNVLIMMRSNKSTLLGLGLMALFATIAYGISCYLVPPLAPPVLGVLIGILLANTCLGAIPQDWYKGIRLTSTWVLRTAIVLYGFKVPLVAVLSLGVKPILVDVLMVFSILAWAYLWGRLLRIDKETACLVGMGSAICGAAAVMGTEAILGNKPEKTAVAISTVVLFGTLSMLLYPLMYHLGCFLSFDKESVGIYMGSAIHEVAQVVAAGSAVGDKAMEQIAVTTKMVRVMMLAPILLGLSYCLGRRRVAEESKARRSVSIPWFAVLFVVMIFLNAGLAIAAEKLGLSDAYNDFVQVLRFVDDFALTMAMVALGTGATIAKMRGAGYKPFLLALLLFIWLVTFGYILVYLLA